jgi:redox-sensitive bicupin YhaK (pirin superfamily)
LPWRHPDYFEEAIMVNIRRADERGRTNWAWLDSRHSFSFGEYFDAAFMGYRALRVINDDRVQPGAGFGTHRHRDMEILSYVLDGALEHRDSLGNGSVIRPGQIQHMRAGTGVEHSEYNPSSTEPTHFLQIWIKPGEQGLSPKYGEQTFDREQAARGFVLLASRDGRDGSVALDQDVDLWVTLLDGEATRSFELKAGRSAWVHIARGSVVINGAPLRDGDAAVISDEAILLTSGERAEILLFDLA